jgi:hypothetical protein
VGINSKNKAKDFWEMLRNNKANVTPSQIIDPVDKTTIIDKKGKIEKCLVYSEKTYFLLEFYRFVLEK